MDIKSELLRLIQKKESDLPALPVVINRIVAAASDEKTTAENLAEIISYDQGITTRLLKLANSIYYAQQTKVETVKRAISVIGFDEIIGIALSMGLLSSFRDKTDFGLDMKALWIHGIAVATVSKELARRTHPALARKIFIPGLLHDMGKVIFSIYFKDVYRKVRQLAMEKKIPLYQAENSSIQMDHAILSGLLMKRWTFPDSIIMPCRFHHTPESAPIKFKHPALIINLADYLSQKAGIGHSGNPVPVAVKNSPKKLGLNNNILPMLVDQLKNKEKEINEFFRITTE